MARHIDQELLNLCLRETLQAHILADACTRKRSHQPTQRMRFMHLIGSIKHEVEWSWAALGTGTVKRSDARAWGHQEIEQLHSSRVGPLQIVQNDDQWAFSRQRMKEMGNGVVEVAPFKLWTNRLRLGKFWQLETHFRLNFGEVYRTIAQNTAKLLGITHLYIDTDGIRDWLIRE